MQRVIQRNKKIKIKNAKTDAECNATVLRWKTSHDSEFVGGTMVIWRAGVCDVERAQIITIPCSSRACHAEGRQIERTNGSWGDAVWSNLVQEEVWWLRERHGAKEPIIPAIKERDIQFHLNVQEHL